MNRIKYRILSLFDEWAWLRRLACRFTGHAGVYWHNASGTEPDMHCKRCGENLG